MELDSKVQAPEVIVKEKESFRVCYRDKTVTKVGPEYVWIWLAIEDENKEILPMSISIEHNMFVVAERFLSNIVEKYGKHLVSTDIVKELGILHKPVSF